LKKRYDVILIDSSPSLNEETLAVILASDELLVVTTPDYPTLGMTMKSVKIARQRGTPISGLIINKVYKKILNCLWRMLKGLLRFLLWLLFLMMLVF